MIDIHSHILNNIDDGARDLEASLKMCRIAQENGIDRIVATPHVRTMDNAAAFTEKRDERIRVLRERLAEESIAVEIFPGAEVFIDDDIFFADDLTRLTINSSRYLLVEFSFRNLRLRKIYEYLDEIVKTGLVPIIAHPERYEYFQEDYDAVNSLAKNGVLFQLNAASLASLDGRREFELAYSMAYNGLASFIGTDAHSPVHRSNNIAQMMQFFPADISPHKLEVMLHDSAKAVLADEAVPRLGRKQISRR
ncbi:MAG: hypothetical protein IIU80_04230 [Clostridia bacterium]|nr:hypothetical protein [Clostridia bacterium]